MSCKSFPNQNQDTEAQIRHPLTKNLTLTAIILAATCLSSAQYCLAAPKTAEQTPDQLEQIKLKSADWGAERQQATALTNAHKYQEAEAIYKKIIAEREGLLLDLSAEYDLLGQLYLTWGKKDDALAMYQKLVAIKEKANGADDDQMVFPLNQYADCLAKLGHKDDAAKMRARVKKIESNSNVMPKFAKITSPPGSAARLAEAKATRDKGEALMLADQQPKALEYFKHAVALDPKDAQALLDRGEALFWSQQEAKAMLDYNQVIKMRPALQKAYVDRAYAYEAADKYAPAIADFEKAVLLDPKDTETLGALAKLLDERGKHKEAIEYYSKALAVKPDLYWPYVQRALAYSSLGETKKALDDYDTLIKRAPTDADYYEFRGGLYAKIGEPEKALADFDKVISLKPTYGGGYSARAKVYEKIDGKKSPRVMADIKTAKKYGAE